jgi:hypothetical protein
MSAIGRPRSVTRTCSSAHAAQFLAERRLELANADLIHVVTIRASEAASPTACDRTILPMRAGTGSGTVPEADRAVGVGARSTAGTAPATYVRDTIHEPAPNAPAPQDR